MSTIEKLPNSISELKTSAEVSTESRGCRFCNHPIENLVADLGLSPLCQSQIEHDKLNHPEVFYPLRAFVCDKCLLVQVHEHVAGEEIFSHYAYFSSFSDSWLQHCKDYSEMIIERLHLNCESFVVEVASNDGYMLQNFVEKNVPCLGIEPATNVAEVARKKNIDVMNRFFGVQTAQDAVKEYGKADLVMANNVLAHVPDLNDFVGGLHTILSDTGTLTVEFPHLKNLMELNQFDTIYQEHYCYFSVLTLEKVFKHHGMQIYDVEKIPTHGGSLRIYVKQQINSDLEVRDSVSKIITEEKDAGLGDVNYYGRLQDAANSVKYQLLEFLIRAKRDGKTVCGYGAPGKGNTLLNFCGIREDLLPFTVDRNTFKQGSFLVGSRIPVYAPEAIEQLQPDYVLILPWNLKDEICEQLSYVKNWGAKLVVPIPELTVMESK
ncbi:class I SAM-dependent methyltransferase [Pirellulaceae bacterium]|nr:class I SAM-dependent methyltransferase [Pirellulaceae bacterium]MDB4640180.1 class I SAM-dependent methyltransferase [Pirellulaceae bacterium]